MSDAADFLQDRAAHAVFAPSAAHRWFYCSDSLFANLLEPDNGSQEAAYGTIAHEIAANYLRLIRPPRHLLPDLLGETFEVTSGDNEYAVVVDERMIDTITQYVDFCDEPGPCFIERRVDFSRFTPIAGQTGTCDHAVYSDLPAGPCLAITDLKTGYIRVEARENLQLMLYAIGLILELGLQDSPNMLVQLRICQPVLDNFDVWGTNVGELMQWGEAIKERAEIAWSGEGSRTPGEKQCQWCKVKATCPALLAKLSELSDQCFEEVSGQLSPSSEVTSFRDTYDRKDLETAASAAALAFGVNLPAKDAFPRLSTAHLSYVFRQRKLFRGWFDAIGEELDKRATAGEVVPWLKLVDGKSARYWKHDVAPVVEHLLFLGLTRDQIFAETLPSPAQAEDLLVALGYRKRDAIDLIAGLVGRHAGKPTLVLESDPRDSSVSTGELFDELPDV